MKLLKIALFSLALAPLPLTAQSLHDSHDLRWAPSGKAPSVNWHYRGKSEAHAAGDCRAAAAPLHLAGKTVIAGRPAKSSGCDTSQAVARQGHPEVGSN